MAGSGLQDKPQLDESVERLTQVMERQSPAAESNEIIPSSRRLSP